MRKREYSHAESVRYLSQVDPDLLLVDAYIMKRMTPEEAEMFETRLSVDIALFEKVWPMIMVARLERSPVAAQLRANSADVLAFAPRSRKSRFVVWGTRFAAACVVIVGLFLVVGESYFRLATRHNYGIERAEGRALTTDMVRPWTWSADRGTPTLGTYAQGAVRLAPNSQTTRALPASFANPLRALDGEALISVFADKRMTFRTATAQIGLTHGYFQITSVPGSGYTTLVVYEGTAAVDRFPATPGAVPPTEVLARHRAIIGRDHSIVVDSIGDEATPEKDFYTRFRERGKP